MRDPTPNIPAKDYLLVAPLAGSVLALSWEIGSFTPIGSSAFGYYSVAEHLAFALQALPHGFLTVLFFVALYSMGSFDGSRRSADSFRSKLRFLATTLGVYSAGLVIIIAFIKYYFASAAPTPYFLLVAGFLGAALLNIARMVDTSKDQVRYAVILWVALYATFLAFCVGIEQTRLRIADGQVSEIETDIGKRSLIVLRANATALIGVDRSSGSFVELKGDRIKERSWILK